MADDTNSRYTRTADNLQSLVSDNGLTDAWVQLELGGTAPPADGSTLLCDESAITNTCEVTNKTFYRSSKLITLTPTYYNNEHAKFLDSGGLMLSDMDPILTKFSWTENPNYEQSDDFGGPHGTFYSDIGSVPAGAQASTISMRSGSPVDEVGLTLANGTAFSHGGTGGTSSSLTPGQRRVRGQRLPVRGPVQRRHPDLLRQVHHQPRQHPVRRDHHLRLHHLHGAIRLAGRRLPGPIGAEVDKLGLTYTHR